MRSGKNRVPHDQDQDQDQEQVQDQDQGHGHPQGKQRHLKRLRIDSPSQELLQDSITTLKGTKEKRSPSKVSTTKKAKLVHSKKKERYKITGFLNTKG